MALNQEFQGFCMPLKRSNSASAREQIRSSKKPVVVKFHSPNCGSCIEAGPKLQKAACPHRDDAEFLEVDVEQDSALADELKVTSIPFVAAFKGGKMVGKKVGGEETATYSKFIERILGGK